MINANETNITHVLFFLILVVFTSASVLFLAHVGIITPQENQEELINANFLPHPQAGILKTSTIKLCRYIDETNTCQGQSDSFNIGEDIYILIPVTTTSSNNQIFLKQEYSLKDAQGTPIQTIPQETTLATKKDQNTIHLKTKLSTLNLSIQEYSIEVTLTNPNLDKTETITTEFSLEEIENDD